MTNSKLKVYLAHAPIDKPAVRELYLKLLSEGWVDVWLDEEKMLPGQNWDLEIKKAVDAASVIIVCISSNSAQREGYVQRELRYVLDVLNDKPEGSIFLIPARLDECDVPNRLRQFHFVDLFEPKGYQRLLRSLRTRAEDADFRVEVERRKEEETKMLMLEE